MEDYTNKTEEDLLEILEDLNEQQEMFAEDLDDRDYKMMYDKNAQEIIKIDAALSELNTDATIEVELNTDAPVEQDLDQNTLDEIEDDEREFAEETDSPPAEEFEETVEEIETKPIEIKQVSQENLDNIKFSDIKVDNSLFFAKGGAIYEGDKVKIKDSGTTMKVTDISKNKKDQVEFSGEKGSYLIGDIEKMAKGGEVIFTDLKDNTSSRKIWESKKSSNGQKSFGAFAHKIDKKYIGDYYLYKLDDYDEKFYSHIPLKDGEMLARVQTDNMVTGEMPLVKINIKNGRVYFMSEDNDLNSDYDDKNPKFNRASANVVFLSLDKAIKDYAKGGETEKGYLVRFYEGSYQFKDSSEENIYLRTLVDAIEYAKKQMRNQRNYRSSTDEMWAVIKGEGQDITITEDDVKNYYGKGGSVRRTNISPLLRYTNFEDGWIFNLVKLNPLRNQDGLKYKGNYKYGISRQGPGKNQEVWQYATLEEANKKYDELIELGKTYSKIKTKGNISKNYAKGGTIDKNLTYKGEVVGFEGDGSESPKLLGEINIPKNSTPKSIIELAKSKFKTTWYVEVSKDGEYLYEIADDSYKGEYPMITSYAKGGLAKGYHKMPDGTIMKDSEHYAKGGEIEDEEDYGAEYTCDNETCRKYYSGDYNSGYCSEDCRDESGYAKGGEVRRSPIRKLAFEMYNKEYNQLSSKEQKKVEDKRDELMDKDYNSYKKKYYAKGGVTPHYNAVALEHRHNLKYGDSKRFASEKEAIEWGKNKFKEDGVGLVEIDRVRPKGENPKDLLIDTVYRVNDTYPLGERVVMKPFEKGGFIEGNYWGIDKDEYEELIEEKQLDLGKWVLYYNEAMKEWEATMDGNYTHTFKSLNDLMERKNEIDLYEYDEELTEEYGEEVITNSKGEIRKYAKGGETDSPITNYKKNIMGTTSFDLKVKGMRKPQDFIVYPITEKTDKIRIQSGKKFGEIHLPTGKGILSKSGNTSWHLSSDMMNRNVNTFELSEAELQEFINQIKSTSGKSVGSSFVKSDNSGARLLEDGGKLDMNEIDIYQGLDGDYTIVMHGDVYEMNHHTMPNMSIDMYAGNRAEFPADISHWGKTITYEKAPIVIKNKIEKRAEEYNKQFAKGGEVSDKRQRVAEFLVVMDYDNGFYDEELDREYGSVTPEEAIEWELKNRVKTDEDADYYLDEDGDLVMEKGGKVDLKKFDKEIAEQIDILESMIKEEKDEGLRKELMEEIEKMKKVL